MVNVSGATRFSQADRELADKLKKGDKEDPETWFLYAEELAKQNRMDEARQCMDMGLNLQKQPKSKHDQDDPETWFLLAEELAKQDRLDEAQQCVDKGLSLQKQSKGKRRK